MADKSRLSSVSDSLSDAFVACENHDNQGSVDLSNLDRGLKRIHSSSSTDPASSPSCRPKDPKLLSTPGNVGYDTPQDSKHDAVSLDSIYTLFKNFVERYDRDMQNMDVKFKELKKDMCTKSELSDMKDSLLIEMSGVQSQVQKVAKDVETFSSELDDLKNSYGVRLNVLEKELAALNFKTSKPPEKEPFHTDVTCVLTGIRHSANEDLDLICKDIVQGSGGLDLKDVNIIRTARVGMKPGKQGVVKMQLETLNDKLKVLRAKAKLKDKDRYKRIYIRTSKSHEQRLIELHTQEILGHLGIADQYFFTGSGRYSKKIKPVQLEQTF